MLSDSKEIAIRLIFSTLVLSVLFGSIYVWQKKADAQENEQVKMATEAIQNNEIIVEAEMTEKTEKTNVSGFIFSSTTYRYFFIIKGKDGNKTEIEVEHDLYINTDVGDTVILYKGYDEAPRGFKKLYLEVRKVVYSGI